MKIAILISGRGSNMLALADAVQKGAIKAEIVTVLSNNPDAAGLQKASDLGIETDIINHRDFDSREAFEEALQAKLEERGTELVCLAGFMRLLEGRFVNKWKDRMINIHPSLLPSYKGLDTHSRVLEDGVPFTGCTVHFVRPDMDSGPIIAQAVVPIADDDDADSLAARVLKAENQLYPRALRALVDGELRVSGKRVRRKQATTPPQAIFWPLD